MKSRKMMRVATCALALTLGAGVLAGCKKDKPDDTNNGGGGGNSANALVVMTQELNGLFNPFYSTAGTDMDVVGQTQISMFTTDSNGDIAYGNKEAVVVLDYDTKYDIQTKETDYYFVIKNGIKFSDGKPLTMNDILFNMYVYLDPTYTGSTTMYSTKIKGLQAYRTQKNEDGDVDSAINEKAQGRAINRRNELKNLYEALSKNKGYATSEEMREAIANSNPSDGYKLAIKSEGDIVLTLAEARAQLLADYNRIVGDPSAEKGSDEYKGLFRLELENDYAAAWDSFQVAPYVNQVDEKGNLVETNSSDIDFTDPIVCFMYMEGFIKLEYAKDPVTNKDITNHIVGGDMYNTEVVKDKESAIEYVFNNRIENDFTDVITYFQTASTIMTEYIALAKDVVLHENVKGDGDMDYPNIEGIRSLGHEMVGHGTTMDAFTYPGNSVEVNGTTYKIAKTHKADGTPANAGEYDVLRITTVEGTDPKAIWNFGFTVAPHHYYSDADHPVDIKNSKFGVEWASFEFHDKVLQGKNANGVSKNKVPLGAGAYEATDRNNNSNPTANGFIQNDSIVYFKANEHFFVGVEGADASLHPANIKKLRYQVVSSSNALNQLETGGVHFVEPQFTTYNYNRIQSLGSQGIKSLSSWQLGYGYIGINAGKVEDINLRKAIMSAMDISRALDYYYAGTVRNISWPMSLVNWAYPRTAEGVDTATGLPSFPDEDNETKADGSKRDYVKFVDDATAKRRIEYYMSEAGVSAKHPSLKIKFTIAGSDLTEHPCYAVFRHAADLLNDCGWQVEVVPDMYALTKLATGSLAVWAAAWGSTIDPDMYQVYHKNSTATSTYSWGYREILQNQGRVYENDLLTELSWLIDDAREIEDRARRSAIYKEAMGLVLDLAVELPVYQRQTLYAYDSTVIDEKTFQHDANGKILMNPYSSPLGRIWEIDFVK